MFVDELEITIETEAKSVIERLENNKPKIRSKFDKSKYNNVITGIVTIVIILIFLAELFVLSSKAIKTNADLATYCLSTAAILVSLLMFIYNAIMPIKERLYTYYHSVSDISSINTLIKEIEHYNKLSQHIHIENVEIIEISSKTYLKIIYG